MHPQCGMIVAMTQDGVIGLNGKMPWHYSADLKHFKQTTLNSTVIMGRCTWESLPIQPLPQRQNIVITSRNLPDVEHYPSIEQALKNAIHSSIWFIGGARIFEEAVNYCNNMDVTIVPNRIEHPACVSFPKIDWSHWQAGPSVELDGNKQLHHRIYSKIN